MNVEVEGGYESESDRARYAVLSGFGRQFAWFATSFDAEDFVKLQPAPHRYEIVELTYGSVQGTV